MKLNSDVFGAVGGDRVYTTMARRKASEGDERLRYLNLAHDVAVECDVALERTRCGINLAHEYEQRGESEKAIKVKFRSTPLFCVPRETNGLVWGSEGNWVCWTIIIINYGLCERTNTFIGCNNCSFNNVCRFLFTSLQCAGKLTAYLTSKD